MMKLQAGHQYELLNLEVPQGLSNQPPYIVIHDIFEYKGQYIVSGRKFTHEQHIYIHGFEVVEQRPVAFVVLPNEPIPENVHSLSKLMKGLRLAIQNTEHTEVLNIVNWAKRLGSLWYSFGHTPRDELLRRGQVAIDLYYDWRATGIAPQWFLEARNKATDEQPSQ